MTQEEIINEINESSLTAEQIKNNFLNGALEEYDAFIKKVIEELKFPDSVSTQTFEKYLMQLSGWIYFLNNLLHEFDIKRMLSKEDTYQKYSKVVRETEGTLAWKDAVAAEATAENKLIEGILNAIFQDIQNKIYFTKEYIENIKRVMRSRVDEFYINGGQITPIN